MCQYSTQTTATMYIQPQGILGVQPIVEHEREGENEDEEAEAEGDEALRLDACMSVMTC